jgi:hypothetical protein
MSDHTPGPWRVRGLSIIGAQSKAFPHEDPDMNCYFVCSKVRDPDDARLIAAAPDLSGMLLDVLTYLDDQADVVDGDYGQPAPNKAMRLVQEIEEVLTKAGVDHGRLA